MTGGSLGLRSGSYGSLQYLQNGSVFPVQSTPTPPRKPYKTFKEKESLLHCIFKFAGRKKIGMLFLSVVSAAVFVWVLYVGKGEDSSDNDQMQNITVGGASAGGGYLGSSPLHIQTAIFGSNLSSVFNNVRTANTVQPSSPEYFLGYKLPQNHPCEHFVLPPPPADKKRTGPRPCPVCYLPVEEAIALMPKAPSFSPVIKNLSYVINDNLTKREFGGSEFGGYPSLKQRNDSFDIRESMTVHCGFVRGSHPGRGTGFDMDESDLRDMEQCRGIVVASAIFETFDEIQQPKNISEHAKENACFFMFVDEETEMYMRNQSGLDRSKRLGLWRIVVVRNLAYTDGRRNGKVPKLLMHRMFPNARYSLWIDGKLELVVDPYQILERFLWRKNATFAISKHYKRFDVFVEAEANKAAGKYDNTSIDFQVEFYKKEGLTPYTEDKFPIISDVPEGCVLIREHIPISNLFSCLWFNEVDRFTSRDQISFSTVRDKIMAKVDWNIYMFQDCERRNFVVQAYHRDVLEHMAPLALGVHPPPPLEPLPERVVINPVRRNSVKRGRERRSGSRRHRKVSAGGKGRYLI